LRELLLAGNDLGHKGLFVLLQGLPQLLLLDVSSNAKVEKGGAVVAAACSCAGHCQVVV
jgi:hypothetical protein